MMELNTIDMLKVWEHGLNQPLLQRALILLVAACPELEPDAAAELSIGQRDERLLQLRERLFGSKLVNTAVCSECSERVEWENRVADIRIPSLQDESMASEFEFKTDNYHLHFRLPNSLDLADVIHNEDKSEAIKGLLIRCILKAECAGEDQAVDQLPDHIIQSLNQRIEALDPQARILIHLCCPACSHSWDAQFDIASFLWTELNDWAERMLLTVHKLAVGYGWSERKILNLSQIRRQLYLGMLGP